MLIRIQYIYPRWLIAKQILCGRLQKKIVTRSPQGSSKATECAEQEI
jgi:hypothetical protein